MYTVHMLKNIYILNSSHFQHFYFYLLHRKWHTTQDLIICMKISTLILLIEIHVYTSYRCILYTYISLCIYFSTYSLDFEKPIPSLYLLNLYINSTILYIFSKYAYYIQRSCIYLEKMENVKGKLRCRTLVYIDIRSLPALYDT